MAKKHSHSETEAHEEEVQKGDFEALLDHVKENPLLYTVGAVFIVVCALAGVFYRLYSDDVERERTAEYARALDIEDPVEQSESLAKLALGNSALSAEILYLSGEMAFRGADAAKAEAAFARLRVDFPDYEFTPDAIEGLGYIEENAGNYVEAIAKYQEILDKFPDSFAGRRQSFNIGRTQEQVGEVQAAIDAYRDQLTTFPGSNVARRAQAALDRLRESNNELFSGIGTTDTELLSTLESVLESVKSDLAEDSAAPEEEASAEPEDEAPTAPEDEASAEPAEEATPSEPVDAEPEAAEATEAEEATDATEVSDAEEAETEAP
jgi:tetratricopeptide (TPR) repeat protein